MRIHSLDIRPFEVGLFAPFGVATGAQEVAKNVLVTLTLENGVKGHGEAAPFPAINGETQEHAIAALEACRGILVGESVSDWRRLARRIASCIDERRGPTPSARCALETAILDAMCRARGIPLVEFFGGATRELATDMTITIGSVKQAEKDTKAALERGIRTLKVKIGGADLDVDLERVTRVRQVAPDSPLILDGNCAYDARTALRLIELLGRRKITIALFEQPVAKQDLDGMHKIADESDVRIAADESVGCAADALLAIRRGGAAVINIKLMKCGIAEALDIAAVARATGTALMIGGMVETRLAMGASACFAAGLGGFEFVDLDTPLFLTKDPFCGGYTMEGDRIHLEGIRAGHGIDPDSAFFGA